MGITGLRHGSALLGGRSGRRRVERAAAEDVLLACYPRLTRLAYLALPVGMERHRRVLRAHHAVQHALPLGAGPRTPERSKERPPATAGERAAEHQEIYHELRRRTLLTVLAEPRRRPWSLPRVWGMRVFPPPGGSPELALEELLGALDAPARVAYGLRHVEGLGADEAGAVLVELGLGHEEVVAALAAVAEPAVSATAEVAARSTEFDPCTLRARSSDIPTRRRRAVMVPAAAGAVAAALLAFGLGAGAGRPAVSAVSGDAAVPTTVLRAAPDLWRHTARIDFSAWPARGDRTGDAALIDRALRAWSGEGPVRRDIDPGAWAGPPEQRPQLLFAGEVDGTGLVLLYDGSRLVRYAVTADATPRLEIARADQSDVTTAGAVILSRGPSGDRFLLAPWVATVQQRDLLAPDSPSRDVAADQGLTAALPAPTGGCRSLPVLQLRSSPVIAEHHAFLLTDLGGMVPAHLTYLPPPQHGPANYPREATGSDALELWSHLGCSLRSLRGSGVKAVNAWDFAGQQLPENAGQAQWVCARADRWDGTGSAWTAFLGPAPGSGAPARITAAEQEGRACSRFQQYTVAATWWSSPAGVHYLLAAGSRHLASLQLSGAVSYSGAPGAGHAVALRAAAPGPYRLVARLDTGEWITPLPPAGGPR
ncbi:hypothetical protein [Phaeacidiphilus oryzae]|uniref:hypothetical protein n=1 Tax=Phaeacidiphilus oryzae TaxID=348818 RepID=UPI00068DDF33|nr:hypothetical protein [Phaeacidiphilus oryzae]